MRYAGMFLRDRRVYSIGEFVALELAPSAVNQSGVFVDATYVAMPVPNGFGAVLEVAMDANGRYHVSCHASTASGYRGFSPSSKWNSLGTREEAFVAGVHILQGYFRHKLSRKYFSEAKREYFRRAHRQLELFE